MTYTRSMKVMCRRILDLPLWMLWMLAFVCNILPEHARRNIHFYFSQTLPSHPREINQPACSPPLYVSLKHSWAHGYGHVVPS